MNSHISGPERPFGIWLDFPSLVFQTGKVYQYPPPLQTNTHLLAHIALAAVGPLLGKPAWCSDQQRIPLSHMALEGPRGNSGHTLEKSDTVH